MLLKAVVTCLGNVWFCSTCLVLCESLGCRVPPCLNLFSCPVTHRTTSSFLGVKNLLRIGKFFMAPFQWTFDGVLRSVSIREQPALNILTSSPVRPSDAHAHLLKKLHRANAVLSDKSMWTRLYDLLHVRNWASLEPMTLPDK